MAGASQMTTAALVHALTLHWPEKADRWKALAEADDRARLEGAMQGSRMRFGIGPERAYRVVEEHPYLDREEEWDGLTLDEAATRVEDLYPVEAAQIISDVEEGVDWPMRYVDEETGREVTLSKAVS